MLFLKNSRIIYYKYRVNKYVFSVFSRSSNTFNKNENILLPLQQKQIEEKWKDVIVDYSNENVLHNARSHEKKYILSMFPYPSGNLHLGHVRVYTISDVMARFYRMKGWKVIHPMGWDAFGLPAENAAIERGVDPHEWTKSNINSMKNQLKSLGLSFDWWREVATCDPDYYKWTQFIFLKLFQEGLAYRKEAIVNWDPIDQTVLANEQVDENGFSWRSGAKVEKKVLTQWFIKSTKFSKDLLKDLSDPHLKNWKDISTIQKNWIGDCNGYVIEMRLIDSNNKLIDSFSYLPVWMSEPEYLTSIGFLSVKSDHILNTESHIDYSIDGFKVLNIKAVDPISKRLIPIIVNVGAVDEEVEIQVGLPHLRERDHQICEKLKLAIPQPIIESEKKILREQIITKLKEINSGGYECSSVLKDWLISRQRYWGTPIPIVYCNDCGTVPVPEEQLPVILPQVNKKVGKGVSTLKEAQDWLKCPCPSCGKLGKRETDTMDTFVDSSWYFLRYLDPKNNKELINKDKGHDLMPVDLYIGGKEHAVLHLYYARFIYKFLSHIGLASHKEPFKELLVQGLIKSKSYRVKSSGKYLREEEVDFSVSPPVEKNTKEHLTVEFEKMSKSKHNGVNPQVELSFVKCCRKDLSLEGRVLVNDVYRFTIRRKTHTTSISRLLITFDTHYNLTNVMIEY
ncbi:putative leucine--tRNA ligase, mitochondrial [Armadillidium nasatum]|uniref:leucine--tRNA ligase n=2 Tax=Armadillidium nasatum TaxID=96803 RepID=A0A5N5SW71_9CRUS|nr:putative leucine--tRNA ligase, mitochondrial [Armadillidium nasatum]